MHVDYSDVAIRHAVENDLCINSSVRIAQNFDGGKVTKFDECMLNRQSFPYENFALRKSQYCIFYVRL